MAVDILTAVHQGQKKIEARRSRLLAVVVVLVLWGLITHGTYAGTGDEPHYQMIVHSLVFDRDLDLTSDYGNPDNLALGGHFEGGAHLRPGKDGRLRPVHDIGMPLLFAPYYAVAYRATEQIVAHVPARWLERARLNFTVILRHLLSLAMIGITAWMAVRLLEIFVALSASPTRAFVWVLLLVLSPPILSHSFLFFTEIFSAFIALNVFIWLRQVKAPGTPGASGHSRLEALLAGAAVGCLFLVHARNVGLMAGLMTLAMLQSRRWPDRGTLVAFMGGTAALLAVRTGVNYHFWGTLVTSPHQRFGVIAGWQPFVTESATRVAGWLFDQEDGLLPYAPIYLLAPAGWFALWKRDRELCAAISLVAGAYVGVITIPVLNANGWRAGWSPAARYLVPVIPFLAILAFSAVAHVRRLPAVVLILAGAQVVVDAILWQHPGLLWNNGIGTSALLKYLDRGTGWLSAYVPSVFTPVDGLTIVLVAAASGCWLALTAALITINTRDTA